MLIFFLILILLLSIVLAMVILIQNPKGGGLAGNIAGFSNQFMGVKQTTDVLEKGTWIFAALIAILCLFSGFFIKPGGPNFRDPNLRPTSTQSAPAPTQSQPTNTVPANPGK
jgi:preprotein translocase subunit SecG